MYVLLLECDRSPTTVVAVKHTLERLELELKDALRINSQNGFNQTFLHEGDKTAVRVKCVVVTHSETGYQLTYSIHKVDEHQ